MFGIKKEPKITLAKPVDIIGLRRSEVLAALWNAAGDGAGHMTPSEAMEILGSYPAQFIDRVHEKSIKLELKSSVAVHNYNRDNKITAEEVIANLRKLNKGKLKAKDAPEYLQAIIANRAPEGAMDRLYNSTKRDPDIVRANSPE